MNQEVELVVFDIAGTTVKDDRFVHQALARSMADHGYAVSLDEANRVMGYPKPFAIGVLLNSRGDIAYSADAELVTRIHDDFLRHMRSIYDEVPIVPADFALESFDKLRSLGIRIALDTGFSRDITDLLLRKLGWDSNGLIDAWISSDEVQAGRPHPYMIRELMTRLGVRDAQRVAKVGDTVSDMQEGKSAGCRYVIGVTNGSHTYAELEHTPHTHLAANMAVATDIIINGL